MYHGKLNAYIDICRLKWLATYLHLCTLNEQPLPNLLLDMLWQSRFQHVHKAQVSMIESCLTRRECM